MLKKILFFLFFIISIIYTTTSTNIDNADDCYHPLFCNLDKVCNYPLENYTSCPQDCNCYTLPNIYNCTSTPSICNYQNTPLLCNCYTAPSIYNCSSTPLLCNYDTTPSICNCDTDPSRYNCIDTPDICNYQLTPDICNCETDPLRYNCRDTPSICNCPSTHYCCNGQCINKNEMCCSIPNKPIPDYQIIYDTITISNMATNNLTVYLDISHNFPSDLIISLNNNATQILFDKKCSNFPDYIIMYLSDSATYPLTVGSCNFINDYFKPDESFSIFNNIFLTNSWTLIIDDNEPIDSGTLNKWCLFNNMD